MSQQWGPQATGGIGPSSRRPAGGTYLLVFVILWTLTSPIMMIVAFSTAKGWPEAFERMIWINLALGAVGAIIGWRNSRSGQRFMFGRTGVIVAFCLLAPTQLVAYGLGFLLGRIKRRPRRRTGSDVVMTETAWVLAAPDAAAALNEAVTRRTGKPPGAVLGWSLDGQDQIVTAPPRGGVLVLGPPGSGKTSAILIPTILIAPGAVVASSIKSDLMAATFSARSRRGIVWHFDPGGDEITPRGVQHVRWSPLVSVRSWDDALQTGLTMAAPLQQADKQSGGGDHFVTRATDWVQCLLYAAHLDSRPIAQVAEWSMAAASEEAQTEVMAILDTAEEGGDAGARIAGRKLLGLISTPDRERGSIISSMVSLLRVYDSVSAREIGEDTNFDPRQFVRSADTLYITSRPDKQKLYAPLLAALLEQIRFETYDRHKAEEAGAEPRRPHVTFALDEANTTAPIPLPAIISEAGGQGLHIVVGIQAIGPAIARWGDAAKSFLTLFPVKVLFRGNFDRDTVTALSEAAGEFDRVLTGYSESTAYVGQYHMAIHQQNPTYSIQRQRTLTPGDITAIPEGRALIWNGPEWGLLAVGMHWQSGVWQTVINQPTFTNDGPQHREQVAVVPAVPSITEL